MSDTTLHLLGSGTEHSNRSLNQSVQGECVEKKANR